MSVTAMQQVANVLDAQVNYVFTLADRCDGDDGFTSNNGRGVVVAEQAYHRWVKGAKEVFLCNHHNAKHEDALVTSGWSVQRNPLWDKLDQPLDINHIGDE